MVAGIQLVGACFTHDVRPYSAAENAIFGQTGPNVGSFDGGYGASYMARLIGQKKARNLVFMPTIQCKKKHSIWA